MSPDLSVALAEIDDQTDVVDLAALRVDWTSNGTSVPDDVFIASFRAWWQNGVDHRHFWIARLGSTPVGMVNLTEFQRIPVPGGSDDMWGYLGNMYVVERCRRGFLPVAGVSSRSRPARPASA